MVKNFDSHVHSIDSFLINQSKGVRVAQLKIFLTELAGEFKFERFSAQLSRFR